MSKFFCYMALLQTVFATMALANDGYGQRLEETEINCDWKNKPLELAFADIQAQTDLFFTYTTKNVDGITISNKNERLSVANILKYISGETGLHFKISEDIVYVYKGESVPQKRTRIEVPPVQSLNNLLEFLDYTVVYEVSPLNVPPEQIIRGKIMDEQGVPLIGATVLIKETGLGTITDDDGSFSLAGPDGGPITLVVSYIGFEKKEVATEGRSEIEIVLIENAAQLDEVVVIGYGTGTKEKFNGAASKVENERINKYSAANFDQAIAGDHCRCANFGKQQKSR